jgi:hypothetical protein
MELELLAQSDQPNVVWVAAEFCRVVQARLHIGPNFLDSLSSFFQSGLSYATPARVHIEHSSSEDVNPLERKDRNHSMLDLDHCPALSSRRIMGLENVFMPLTSLRAYDRRFDDVRVGRKRYGGCPSGQRSRSHSQRLIISTLQPGVYPRLPLK